MCKLNLNPSDPTINVSCVWFFKNNYLCNNLKTATIVLSFPVQFELKPCPRVIQVWSTLVTSVVNSIGCLRKVQNLTAGGQSWAATSPLALLVWTLARSQISWSARSVIRSWTRVNVLSVSQSHTRTHTHTYRKMVYYFTSIFPPPRCRLKFTPPTAERCVWTDVCVFVSVCLRTRTHNKGFKLQTCLINKTH